MKILIPVLHYWPVIGGLETWTQNIAERLSSRAEIFVVTGRVAGQSKKEIKNGVRVFRTSLFSLRDLSHSPFLFILSALPFIFFHSLVILKKEKIDLLHCQGFLSALLGFCLSRMTRVPYIATVQRLETKTWLKKKVYKKAVFCIAVSTAVKAYFEEIGCQKIEVIPNGIDLTKFVNLDRQKARQNLGLEEEFAIITVARLEKVKGIEFLLPAAENFQFAHCSHTAISNFQLIIIGDGSERQGLEGLVKQLGLQDKVKFFGQIPNEEIPQYLAAADCFVLPSLREGFGIAILEAMAAGVPVVASRVGGIPDIVSERQTGLLIEPRNSQAIADGLFQIYSDPNLKHKLIQNGKVNAAKYDWRVISEKVFTVYNRVVQNYAS